MEIIKAENVGIRFKYHREKRGTFKGTVARLISNDQNLPKEFWALKRINFTVDKGETLGIIGRNGSGKTTLLRLIGEILVPDEGYIKVQGTISTLLSLTAGFQQELSGLENIYLAGVLMGFKEREINTIVNDIIDFSELGSFIEAPVKTYSSGMYARLGFSIAINLKRDIMLIDEFLGVGDIKFRKKCEKKFEQIMQEDITIILVSNNMTSIKKFADKAIWLEKPTIKAQGIPEEVIGQYLKS